MNKGTQLNNFAGQILNQERGFRLAMGSAAIIAVLTGALQGESQVIAASFLCIYMVMTAIIGLDPVYALVERLNGRTHTNRLAVDYK